MYILNNKSAINYSINQSINQLINGDVLARFEDYNETTKKKKEEEDLVERGKMRYTYYQLVRLNLANRKDDIHTLLGFLFLSNFL